jgi:hypothetical protein
MAHSRNSISGQSGAAWSPILSDRQAPRPTRQSARGIPDVREAARCRNLRGEPIGANLCGADLRDANLCTADLRGALLYGADLRGASLNYALPLLTEARCWTGKADYRGLAYLYERKKDC